MRAGVRRRDLQRNRGRDGVAKTMKRVLANLSCVLMLWVLAAGMGMGDERSADIRDGPVLKKRHTLKALRDQHVVKQQTDYSCGAAALATLMTYYFGEQTSEQQILELLRVGLTDGQAALKQLRGFSLLDLKHVAQRKGYKAAGFKLTIEQLKLVVAPVIVYVSPRGYPHFAVLRGISGGRVLLADPARGNLRLSIASFLDEWDGTVFVLGKAGEETIRDYPLTVPRDIQRDLVWIDRMRDVGALTKNIAVRSSRP